MLLRFIVRGLELTGVDRCDILGPFNAPFAMASIGVVPGSLLYLLFGIVAFITGCMLAKIVRFYLLSLTSSC